MVHVNSTTAECIQNNSYSVHFIIMIVISCIWFPASIIIVAGQWKTAVGFRSYIIQVVYVGDGLSNI